ncbi:pleckstrin homology domain-containing family A member 8-like isoform X2 [Patiria miniata]|uniref:Pleckstrin homology domain-containing family A member 8 n=1 Tax=Patiria miniata TaxID=46514 RepID=A0A913ZCN8_PATMI|nr:pleckstrin homology domain-containing family A member 8-like isoform X2 [Patiria miniata]
MAEMQGVLFKWTNYLAGWQLRWFVLDKGILAYYKSQDEVHLGSKGSIKIACCEIIVHPSDMCRLDLIIPGEQHFYIRGTSPAERQQWLVALGSAKACLTDAKQQQKDRTEELLKAKMSELRLYCDTLMQSVASVKISASSEETPDIERLNTSTTLLSETCDTFISTLQDCMRLANSAYSTSFSNSAFNETVVPPSLQQQSKKSTSRSHSVEDRYNPPQSKSGIPTKYKNLEDIAARPKPHRTRAPHHQSLSAPTTPTASTTPMSLSESEDAHVADSGDGGQSHPSVIREAEEKGTLLQVAMQHPSMQEKPRLQTFFSKMKPNFEDVQKDLDDGVKTKLFLDACSQIVAIFDVMGSSAFALVKMDMNGNVKKLRQKYSSNPAAFQTLQSIVQQEKRSNTHQLKNSATDALMWLRRALEFVCAMMEELGNSGKDFSVAATTAYKKSLQKYHGWVVQGVFSVAVRASPYYEDFIKCLLENPEDMERNGEQIVLEDMATSMQPLRILVNQLQQYYYSENLENHAQV